MSRRSIMRQPQRFLIHERWIASIYIGHSFFKGGWTLRHACGRYKKIDLEPLKEYQKKEWGEQQDRWTIRTWREGHILLASKVPVVFGSSMKRKNRRNLQGVCPRCGEKIPGGLAIWVTTSEVRGDD